MLTFPSCAPTGVQEGKVNGRRALLLSLRFGEYVQYYIF